MISFKLTRDVKPLISLNAQVVQATSQNLLSRYLQQQTPSTTENKYRINRLFEDLFTQPMRLLSLGTLTQKTLTKHSTKQKRKFIRSPMHLHHRNLLQSEVPLQKHGNVLSTLVKTMMRNEESQLDLVRSITFLLGFRSLTLSSSQHDLLWVKRLSRSIWHVMLQ